MSVWTTRSLERDRQYVVLQHSIKGVNYVVNGVKFRGGYAVVEKDSKTHNFLKKIPVLKTAKEFPITFLNKLPFITRALDIKLIYGQDVYAKYLDEVEAEKAAKAKEKVEAKEKAEKEENERREEELQLKQDIEEKLEEIQDPEQVEELKAALPEIAKCLHRTSDGTLCKFDAVEYSPSGFCNMHLLDDPRLEEVGIEKPSFMTKKEKKDFREKVKTILKKAKKDGKF